MASISSTALRLAAVEALAPHAEVVSADPVWPTLARGQILDSGSSPADRTEPTTGAIMVSIFSDDLHGTPRGEAYGLDPQDLIVDLIFDIEIPIVSGEEVFIGATDADAAAKLEAEAAQIRHVLTRGPTGAAFRRLAKAFGPISARGTRDPEMQVPLSRLTLRIPVRVDDDDWDDVTDGLPAPASAIRSAFPTGSYAAAVLDGIAGLYIAPDDPTPLGEIRFGFGFDVRPDDLDTAPVAGRVTFD